MQLRMPRIHAYIYECMHVEICDLGVMMKNLGLVGCFSKDEMEVIIGSRMR